ncbi:MAG: hypothetical protein IPN11_06355 [Opitutaceae bacterium]|nr:hypothetical protein [Opitutaceae bacterium]
MRGHNVLMFGGREQRYPLGEAGRPAIRGDTGSGRLTDWWHEPGQGTAWRIDLTPAYDGVSQVARTVLHLWPGYILVLDEADLPAPEDISLRWHTIDRADPEAGGAFVVRGKTSAATGFVTAIEGTAPALHRREHRYAAPYHRARNGVPWSSGRELRGGDGQGRAVPLAHALRDGGGSRFWRNPALGAHRRRLEIRRSRGGYRGRRHTGRDQPEPPPRRSRRPSAAPDVTRQVERDVLPYPRSSA